MLRIGDFSRMAQVSIRTLRHYDDLGLLKPVHIDRFTDYRYYGVEQLPRLNRILALKDLGFSLEQIKHLLDENVPVEQLRGMLVLKQSELEQQMREERERLTRVATRLQQIEQEGKVSEYEVVLKREMGKSVLSARATVPTIADMKQYRCALLEQVYQEGKQRQLELKPPEFVLYHMSEYRENDIDIEMAIGLKDVVKEKYAIQGSKQLMLYELPEVPTMASVVHRGSMYDVGQAMVALFSWIERNRYQTNGAYREIHLFGREDDEGIDLHNVVIEIQLPIEISM